MARLSALLVPMLAFGAGADVQTSIPAVEAARALQAHYDTVRDFTADFVQTYTGGVIRKRLVEQGRLQVKRPGRMRWDYTQPESKTFVSDGSQIYSYLPADHQVYVSPMPGGDQATTAVLFLTGRGNLIRDFDVRYADGVTMPPTAAALRLDPKNAQRDYDWIVLVYDRDHLTIRSLIAHDSQGGTSAFEFHNLRENVGLSDKVFEFRIPRDAELIRGHTSSR